MKLLHELENKNRYAYVYLTSGGEYMVVTGEVIEKSESVHTQQEAEVLAEIFVMKEQNGNT